MSVETQRGGWAAAADAVALLRRLSVSDDVPGFLATAAELARDELGVSRALVLSVASGRLTATDSGALADHASDVLRRRVLAEPIHLPAGTLGPDLRDTSALTALVAAALDLRAPATGVLAPRAEPLAVLVCDRDDDADPGDDAAAATGLAAVFGIALEHAILRRRVADVVSSELRHLMASAQALLGELEHAPLALPSNAGPSAVFPWEALTGDPPAADGLLSEREIAVCERLVAGRSNREIAEDLVLAPDTVKGNVARILRKLGAANRAEAVSRYLTMTSGGQWLTRG